MMHRCNSFQLVFDTKELMTVLPGCGADNEWSVPLGKDIVDSVSHEASTD